MNYEDPVSRCGGDDEDVIESEQSHANDVLFFNNLLFYLPAEPLLKFFCELLRLSLTGLKLPRPRMQQRQRNKRLPILSHGHQDIMIDNFEFTY